MQLVRLFAALNPSKLFLALSAIVLGHAIQHGNGFYNPEALRWMGAALVLAIIATLLHRVSGQTSKAGNWAVWTVLAAGIGWQTFDQLGSAPGFDVAHGNIVYYRTAVVLQAVAVVVGLFNVRLTRALWFPAVLALSLYLGIWMIHASPNPHIDVVVVHKEAIEALLDRKDPYRISFENIYENDAARAFYNPEAVIGRRLAFGYPYPPPSLLFAVPGHVLLGDYRYSEVVLLVLGAALIGYARRGLTAPLAATLLLTTPRVWFVIEQGWTEPIAIFLMAATVFLLIRTSVPAAFTAGIFVVTKQYLGFTGLAVVRLAFMRLRSWRWCAIAGILAAAAVILPFLLWHPNAFMRTVVWLQTREPFRPDSLSFLSWAAREGWGNGSYVWAVSAAVAGAAGTLISTRNTPSGFALSVAATAFIMFAFGSKAFCNYYFFVIGASCCAIAAWPDRDEPELLDA